MQIINPNLIPITAFEALQLIKDLKKEQEKNLKEEIDKQAEGNERSLQQERNALTQHLIPQNLNDLINNFLIYFNNQRPSSLKLPQSNQSATSILNLCSSLRNQFGQVSGNSNGLTRAERLQICDLAPTELVEIYLIIEECDSRFTETEIQSILNLVKENLNVETNATGEGPDENVVGMNGAGNHVGYEQELMNEEEEQGVDDDINLGDVDDDDALVAEAREGGPAPDQELDEVPD